MYYLVDFYENTIEEYDEKSEVIERLEGSSPDDIDIIENYRVFEGKQLDIKIAHRDIEITLV